jgi:hypothetical protein
MPSGLYLSIRYRPFAFNKAKSSGLTKNNCLKNLHKGINIRIFVAKPRYGRVF